MSNDASNFRDRLLAAARQRHDTEARRLAALEEAKQQRLQKLAQQFMILYGDLLQLAGLRCMFSAPHPAGNLSLSLVVTAKVSSDVANHISGGTLPHNCELSEHLRERCRIFVATTQSPISIPGWNDQRAHICVVNAKAAWRIEMDTFTGLYNSAELSLAAVTDAIAARLVPYIAVDENAPAPPPLFGPATRTRVVDLRETGEAI